MTRPLDVQLAGLLGWTRLHWSKRDRMWLGKTDDWLGCRYSGFLPRFSRDWSAIGSLIEKYRVDFQWGPPTWPLLNNTRICGPWWGIMGMNLAEGGRTPQEAAVKVLIQYLRREKRGGTFIAYHRDSKTGRRSRVTVVLKSLRRLTAHAR